jgi:hypothetical protein
MRPFAVEVTRAPGTVTVALVRLGRLGGTGGWATCRGAVQSVADRVPDQALLAYRMLAGEFGADPPPARITVDAADRDQASRLVRIRDLYAILAEALNDLHERQRAASPQPGAPHPAADRLYQELLGAAAA